MITDTNFLSGVPGLLSAKEIATTAAHVARLQSPSGQIPWFPRGHCDPWNHVEAAMALTVSGYGDGARRAYRWLATNQLGDGSWFNYYQGEWVKDARLDTNVCAYVATGVYHYVLATGDVDFARSMWPCVERAIDFVLRWQLSDGTIRWSLDALGRRESYALLTGSSSIFHSLRCAVALAERLDFAKPAWELAAGRLGHAVAHHPGAFAPKNEFAMDWYYPILSGALSGTAAHARMDGSWDAFVLEGRGVRCVSTGEWVTAAETAECVLALDALGRDAQAMELFTWVQGLRNDDGSYWTGMVYPEEATYPPLERSTYTAGAIVLAADALGRTTPASGLFRGEGLPSHLDLTEPAPEALVEPALRSPGAPGPA